MIHLDRIWEGIRAPADHGRTGRPFQRSPGNNPGRTASRMARTVREPHGRSGTLDPPVMRPAVDSSGGIVPKSYVRLTHPLVRDTRGGELRQATWDEALDRTVAGLRAAMAAKAGADARTPIGLFSCS